MPILKSGAAGIVRIDEMPHLLARIYAIDPTPS
jgi:hypothetical protein